MEHRKLGETGLTVSRLALGTWTWGRETGAEDAAEQLRLFMNAGGTLVDTANVYSGGNSERVIGQLLRDVPRDDVVVATKAAGLLEEVRGRSCDASRRHLLAALDASLDRLGVDHVDLWQLHVWDPVTPMEESLAAIDAAVASGRVRYAGISNYSGWQTAAAVTWQRAWPGRTRLASAQVEYSLLARSMEAEVLPAAAYCGLGVLAWSPLGRGVLTGKYRDAVPPGSRATTARAGFVREYFTDRCARITSAVVTAARDLGVTPAAVALTWVRDRPGITAPVVGARTAGQLAESLAAEHLILPPDLRVTLDEVSAPP
jgi:aryl-alcohol dehydrogenase-like predicted oxidoreductase